MIDKKFVIQWKMLDDFWYLKHINFAEDTWGSLDNATLFSKNQAKSIFNYLNCYFDEDNSMGSLKIIELKDAR